MGTNVIVQFLLQPVLIAGVVFHLIMGMYLDYKNRNSRPVNYTFNNPSKNSTWISRNMIITGVMIMLFLGLHFYDFGFLKLSINILILKRVSLIDIMKN